MQITTITSPFMLNMSVNCYVVRLNENADYVLIDTGMPKNRARVEEALAAVGCETEHLKLIVLTHGDVDHVGSAAYLRWKFGVPVAMHQNDAGMVEHGDMFWGRKPPNPVVRRIVGGLMRLKPENRFTPDVNLSEGDSLTAYGFDARVIELPGHSSGNIGILTADGDLFCGDLLGNTKKPTVWSIVDDKAAMTHSVKKLRDYDIETVYPGHGKPFPMSAFTTETH